MFVPDTTTPAVHLAPLQDAAAAGAPPPSGPATGIGAATKDTAVGAANDTLAAQVELMETNKEFMIAMAWLNFVLAVTSKLNGR